MKWLIIVPIITGILSLLIILTILHLKLHNRYRKLLKSYKLDLELQNKILDELIEQHKEDNSND